MITANNSVDCSSLKVKRHVVNDRRMSLNANVKRFVDAYHIFIVIHVYSVVIVLRFSHVACCDNALKKGCV
jgi:cytochrome b